MQNISRYYFSRNTYIKPCQSSLSKNQALECAIGSLSAIPSADVFTTGTQSIPAAHMASAITQQPRKLFSSDLLAPRTPRDDQNHGLMIALHATARRTRKTLDTRVAEGNQAPYTDVERFEYHSFHSRGVLSPSRSRCASTKPGVSFVCRTAWSRIL